MDWLSAILIAVGISSFITVADKYVVSRMAIRPYVLIIGFIGLLSFFLVPKSSVHLSVMQWSFGISIGILFAVTIYATFRAYAQEEVSRLAPLSIFSTILITLGSVIFFDEHLTGLQYLAFALFIVGTVLLATRMKISIEISDFAKFSLFAKKKNKSSMLTTLEDLAHDPAVHWVRFKRKLKLIKGLNWYMLSVFLYIPYTLLAKELNTTTDVYAGFAAIRLGIFIGALLMMSGHWQEFRHTKASVFAVAGIKELFGMTVNFLVLYAMVSGPSGIIQSLLSATAVGVLILSVILGKLGLIPESLHKKDLIQKSAGVAIITVATALLFL